VQEELLLEDQELELEEPLLEDQVVLAEQEDQLELVEQVDQEVRQPSRLSELCS